jgi:hypothetical protein
LANRAIMPSMTADHIVRIDERHLEVQLRKFRLAIGPQILVAKTPSDLDVAVVPSDHHDLFVDLRGLWQGIELAVAYSTGHEIVASALRRASAPESASRYR